MMSGMRFLFVGDSMTIGSTGDHTWRYRMWQHLCTLGEPFTVTGSRTALYDKAADAPVSNDYADPRFPPHARRHFAGWGEGWLHLAPLIGAELRSQRPDVLLISLGLIDLGFYTVAEQTVANTERFVAEARAANPSIRMVMLPVIPNTRATLDPYFADQCAELNARTAKVVSELDTPASPLLLRPGAARLRHPARHVRRHPPQRAGRAPARGGVRRHDVPGVGDRGAVRTPVLTGEVRGEWEPDPRGLRTAPGGRKTAGGARRRGSRVGPPAPPAPRGVP